MGNDEDDDEQDIDNDFFWALMLIALVAGIALVLVVALV